MAGNENLSPFDGAGQEDGGGSSVTYVNVETSLTFLGDYEESSFEMSEVIATDPVGVHGAWSSQLVSVPMLISASSLVCETPNINVENVDTTNDQWDLQATLFICDVAGTNILKVTANGSIPVTGPAQSTSLDWSTATATPILGTDLSWADEQVTSAAGGTYVAQLTVAQEYD